MPIQEPETLITKANNTAAIATIKTSWCVVCVDLNNCRYNKYNVLLDLVLCICDFLAIPTENSEETEN